MAPDVPIFQVVIGRAAINNPLQWQRTNLTDGGGGVFGLSVIPAGALDVATLSLENWFSRKENLGMTIVRWAGRRHRFKTTPLSCKYHLVFCPKYRARFSCRR
jgi:hypothetical protein